MKNNLFLLAIIAGLLFLPNCKATYPQGKVTESIVNICRNEYNLDVNVKITGKTVWVYAQIDDLLDTALGLSSPAGEKLSNILFSISRVTLSTNADLDFFVLNAQDKRIKGVEIVVTRYITDTKRLLVGDISHDEYFQRMDIEINLNSKAKEGRGGEIKLSDFLAKQISQRIENIFKKDQRLKILFKVNSVKGSYNIFEGEKKFSFIVDITPQYPFPKTDIFPSIIKLISQILRRYEYRDFNKVQINSFYDQKVWELDRTEIFKPGFFKK